MDLSQIRTFLSVVDHRGFTGAAREQFVTQPAVTARVKALEAEIGTPLLRRGAREVSLTEAGHRFAPVAREIVRRLDEVRREIGGGKAEASVPLRIGATDTASTHLLPKAMRRYRELQPHSEIRVTVAASRPLIDGVLEGDLELAMVTLPAARRGLQVTALFQEELWIVRAGRKDRAGADRSRGIPRKSGSADLERVAYLAYPRGSTTRRLIDRALRVARISHAATMECGNPEVLRELARAGIGFAVLPRVLVEAEVRGRELVRIVPPRFHATREVGIACRRSRLLSSQALDLLRALGKAIPGKRRSSFTRSVSPSSLES